MNAKLPSQQAYSGQHELLLEWAWGQLEAMADGSLSHTQQQRMRQAMALDADLSMAVGKAKRLHLALQNMSTIKTPSGLWWKLWRIPTAMDREQHQTNRITWFAAPVALASCVIVIALALLPEVMKPDPELAMREAAIKDFQTAMHYVSKSAAISQRATHSGLGGGIQKALSLSLNTWINEDFNFENGE